MIADYQVGGDHYNSLAVQPLDALQAWMSEDAFAGFLLGNCVKYLARRKGERLQDLHKARHYLEMLIRVEEDRALGGSDHD